jgi:hypothetical protein
LLGTLVPFSSPLCALALLLCYVEPKEADDFGPPRVAVVEIDAAKMLAQDFQMLLAEGGRDRVRACAEGVRSACLSGPPL